MNKEFILSNLTELLAQIQTTIKGIKEESDYNFGELVVDVTHAYHHLNTAWNARDVSIERSRQCSESDYYSWRQLPVDLELLNLVDSNGNGSEEDAAHDLYQQARSLLGEEKLYEAVAVLKRSLELSPHFKTLEILGEVYLKLGRPKEAIIPLAAASALNSQLRAPSLLSDALFKSGELDQAEAIANGVLKIEPNNRQALQTIKLIADTKGTGD